MIESDRSMPLVRVLVELSQTLVLVFESYGEDLRQCRFWTSVKNLPVGSSRQSTVRPKGTYRQLVEWAVGVLSSDAARIHVRHQYLPILRSSSQAVSGIKAAQQMRLRVEAQKGVYGTGEPERYRRVFKEGRELQLGDVILSYNPGSDLWEFNISEMSFALACEFATIVLRDIRTKESAPQYYFSWLVTRAPKVWFGTSLRHGYIPMLRERPARQRDVVDDDPVTVTPADILLPVCETTPEPFSDFDEMELPEAFEMPSYPDTEGPSNDARLPVTPQKRPRGRPRRDASTPKVVGAATKREAASAGLEQEHSSAALKRWEQKLAERERRLDERERAIFERGHPELSENQSEVPQPSPGLGSGLVPDLAAIRGEVLELFESKLRQLEVEEAELADFLTELGEQDAALKAERERLNTIRKELEVQQDRIGVLLKRAGISPQQLAAIDLEAELPKSLLPPQQRERALSDTARRSAIAAALQSRRTKRGKSPRKGGH